MNLVEIFIVAAIAQFQNKILYPKTESDNLRLRAFLYANGYSCNELVDVDDRVITSCGLGPEDWQ